VVPTPGFGCLCLSAILENLDLRKSTKSMMDNPLGGPVVRSPPEPGRLKRLDNGRRCEAVP
jgi:hypothetical protein